jgi:hypothetical protein
MSDDRKRVLKEGNLLLYIHHHILYRRDKSQCVQGNLRGKIKVKGETRPFPCPFGYILKMCLIARGSLIVLIPPSRFITRHKIADAVYNAMEMYKFYCMSRQ